MTVNHLHVKSSGEIGERVRWTISCDYSDAFNTYTHTLDMIMRITQSRQGQVKFIQGSSSTGIAQWRQAVRRQEIGA